MKHDPSPKVVVPVAPHIVLDSHDFTVVLALNDRMRPSEVEKLVQPAVSSSSHSAFKFKFMLDRLSVYGMKDGTRPGSVRSFEIHLSVRFFFENARKSIPERRVDTDPSVLRAVRVVRAKRRARCS